MIGEFGLSEVTRPPDHDLDDILEGALAAGLAHGCPLMHYWELYCNEPEDQSLKDRVIPRNLREEELHGLWLIKPDSSLGIAGRYFAGLLGRPS